MKKAIILAALLAVNSSFGASFNWGTGTVLANFAGTVFNSDQFNVTASLILLNNNGVASDMWTVKGDDITITSAANTATPTITGAARNKGKINGTYDSLSIANGQVYGMLITYIDADSKTWYNFSSTTYTVEGLQDATSSLSDAVFAFNFADKSDVKANQVSAGSGWQHVAVPEPSTAALALAGLALLLKRRKA